jgi:cyclopropane-fatty-acyl-phospholipid synthase
MGIASVVQRALGPDLAVAIEAYDGSRAGPNHAVGTLILRSPDAIRRFVSAPGQLGLGRAYVAGDIDFEGDLFATLHLFADHPPRFDAGALTELARTVGVSNLRPLPPPPEEARLHGLRHSKRRDADAIAHHYDVSNDFYRLVLGQTLTYSCGVWERPDVGVDAAQDAKHELICQKLALQPGQRLLDVGCGWGSLVMHAAKHHGVQAVGVTISSRQAELAEQRVKEAGLEDQVQIRLQDYREVHDGPFDAISSVGMFEHVGRKRLAEYFGALMGLLRPEGRLLNHGISRPAQPRDALPVRVGALPWEHRTFISRFVFPDGELHELGTVVSAVQHQGFEVRHVESLREHYALTLRAWVANLEGSWDEAVALAGQGRARVWRLYMVMSAVGFEAGLIQIHQVLADRPELGRSGFPLRPAY